MAEVLSQYEIDALLSALSSGDIIAEDIIKEEEKQKIKLYDFKSPQKFSKEHVRTLELIHDNFARIISNFLTAQLRTNAKVNLVSVQQITYEEFIRSVQNPTILTSFKMAPLNGNVLFETNQQFANQILDVLMGGRGEKRLKLRDFTDIDKNIIKNINLGLLNNLKLAWEDIMKVEIEVEGIETNPALNQTLAPNEPVALITFAVEMVKSNSFINLCIPYLSIDKYLDKLLVQYWFKDRSEEDINHNYDIIKKSINNVEVTLSGLLGTTDITVDDFLKLGLNDVITLDAKCTSPIIVRVEEEHSYYGKPGIIGKKYGITILDIIDKDVLENE